MKTCNHTIPLNQYCKECETEFLQSNQNLIIEENIELKRLAEIDVKYFKEIAKIKNSYYAENQRNYRKNNGKKYRVWGRKSYAKHSEQRKKSVRNWQNNNPDKVRIIGLRQNIKRKENLGFYPLNEWFKNSEGHHLDRVNVIYIPMELHKSVHHSVLKDINMDIINTKALEWAKNNNIILLTKRFI